MASEAERMPSQQALRSLLSYDPETGALTWKARPAESFSTLALWRAWNAKNAYKPAFGITVDGYRKGRLFGKSVSAHRIAWKIVFGSEPEQVDHINGNRSDNRLSNLREATHLDNCRNQKRRVDNRSGATGINWRAKTGRWLAKIGYDGRDIYLGSFASLEDAVEARRIAEVRLGFHERHGTLRDRENRDEG